MSICKEDGANLVNHTASQLIRIYPAGKRVDSSNYNPIIPWANGCQIGKFITDSDPTRIEGIRNANFVSELRSKSSV